MLHDYKLGVRMLLKYPGLTLAGGLTLAIAIGVGAGYYDLLNRVLTPTIPLPEGDRLVLIETQNALTSEEEPRVMRDFLDWRSELRTIEGLGAYRADTRNLITANAPPEPIQIAQITAAAFRTARVSPLIGRALLESDEQPGAPGVLVLGYDVWQRSFGGRPDVVGSIVQLGNTPATVIGVMPEDFVYPVRHDAWTPLSLRASYEPLEGGAIGVIGRLAPGVTLEGANAELRVLGERAAVAFPATHQHLRPVVLRPGVTPGGIIQFTATNLPVLLILLIACMSVGTLVYARTATREGEIAVRSALGASRARIVGQLFVEALVLASVAAAIGLFAADRAVTLGIETVGDAPFWITPGLKLTTIVYAGGLAVVSAVMLSLLPALRVTRARVQTHLANRGAGGATLRFGRVWTGVMIAQVALTAMGIPAAMEGVKQAMVQVNADAAFPSREYLAASIDVDRPYEEEDTLAFRERRARTFAALERRIAQEPGVVAITFADRVPGAGPSRQRSAEVESSPGAGPAFEGNLESGTSAVGPEFFETFARPIVAGRAFHPGDLSPAARTVIVNEAFVRSFVSRGGSGSPTGARLRYSDREWGPASDDPASAAATPPSVAIVGVVRDLGLDPDEQGNETPFVFRLASAETVPDLVMHVHVRGNAATLAARLPVMAAAVDARLSVRDAQPLDQWIWRSARSLALMAAAGVGVTMLILFLSALGIFSLTSVAVSRRTREIGLRAALGANPRHVLRGILSRAVVLMGSGIAAGGALLLLFVAAGGGPTRQPAEDVALFAGYLAVTATVMLSACLLACIGPARRALRINPTEALRDA